MLFIEDPKKMYKNPKTIRNNTSGTDLILLRYERYLDYFTLLRVLSRRVLRTMYHSQDITNYSRY